MPPDLFDAEAINITICSRDCKDITLGSPQENPNTERAIGKLGKGCLDRCLFVSGQEAQQVIVAWRQEYNHCRPHSSLNYRAPAEFSFHQAAVADLGSRYRLIY